jgi:paired amphipathic helix protein Sin3a
VYSQVTQLFREAPDLLEDFKQFLPESAAQARAAAAAKAAAEEAAHGPGSMTGASSTPATRLPAVGTFPPPPSVTKEKGKKRGTIQSQIDVKTEISGVGRGANKVSKPINEGWASIKLLRHFGLTFRDSAPQT